jgi:hypothetical protein
MSPGNRTCQADATAPGGLATHDIGVRLITGALSGPLPATGRDGLSSISVLIRDDPEPARGAMHVIGGTPGRLTKDLDAIRPVLPRQSVLAPTICARTGHHHLAGSPDG